MSVAPVDISVEPIEEPRLSLPARAWAWIRGTLAILSPRGWHRQYRAMCPPPLAGKACAVALNPEILARLRPMARSLTIGDLGLLLGEHGYRLQGAIPPEAIREIPRDALSRSLAGLDLAIRACLLSRGWHLTGAIPIAQAQLAPGQHAERSLARSLATCEHATAMARQAIGHLVAAEAADSAEPRARCLSTTGRLIDALREVARQRQPEGATHA